MRRQDKGSELERAVEEIERTILRSFPGYSEATFTVKRRKILVRDGVRHEFDVWIDIDPGGGYGSVFVFECKNWRAKVGKNEVIVFSKKLEVAKAQRGFLVATAFTRDARAMARQDARLELVTASQMPIDYEMLEGFHVVGVVPRDSKVKVIPWQALPEGLTIALANAKAILDGQSIDVSAYTKSWIELLANQTSSRFPSREKETGVYSLTVQDVRNFSEGQFLVDGIAIANAQLTFALDVHVVWPVAVSSYDVQSRGRVIFLEPIKFPFGLMEVTAIDARRGPT